MPQTPAPQTWPAAHVFPHAPQFSGSLEVSVHLPPHMAAHASAVGVSAVPSGAVSLATSVFAVSDKSPSTGTELSTSNSPGTVFEPLHPSMRAAQTEKARRKDIKTSS